MVSRFQDSENNYMVYRRFGEVQARLLLEAQDDLRRLETKLHYLDIDETDKERGNDPKALFTRKLFNKNSSKERIDLMQALKKAFKEYGMLSMSMRIRKDVRLTHLVQLNSCLLLRRWSRSTSPPRQITLA